MVFLLLFFHPIDITLDCLHVHPFLPFWALLAASVASQISWQSALVGVWHVTTKSKRVRDGQLQKSYRPPLFLYTEELFLQFQRIIKRLPFYRNINICIVFASRLSPAGWRRLRLASFEKFWYSGLRLVVVLFTVNYINFTFILPALEFKWGIAILSSTFDLFESKVTCERYTRNIAACFSTAFSQEPGVRRPDTSRWGSDVEVERTWTNWEYIDQKTVLFFLFFIQALLYYWLETINGFYKTANLWTSLYFNCV